MNVTRTVIRLEFDNGQSITWDMKHPQEVSMSYYPDFENRELKQEIVLWIDEPQEIIINTEPKQLKRFYES